MKIAVVIAFKTGRIVNYFSHEIKADRDFCVMCQYNTTPFALRGNALTAKLRLNSGS